MIRAARFYGVPPWELLDRPKAYVDMALIAEHAEDAGAAQRRREQEGGNGWA